MVSMLRVIEICIQKADAVVSPLWIRACYEPDEESEAALQHSRFHPAPALTKV